MIIWRWSQPLENKLVHNTWKLYGYLPNVPYHLNFYGYQIILFSGHQKLIYKTSFKAKFIWICIDFSPSDFVLKSRAFWNYFPIIFFPIKKKWLLRQLLIVQCLYNPNTKLCFDLFHSSLVKIFISAYVKTIINRNDSNNNN